MNIIDLDSENDFMVKEIGNKASNIMLIRKFGFRTAAGFVIPINVFEDTVEWNNAEKQYLYCKDENDFVKFRELIKTFQFKQDFLDELRNAIMQIGYPVIVRSSSPLEDNIKTSMAGMYLSVGNISGEKELISAIREVWASAFYNKIKKHMPLAILVQKYHSAHIGGVVFSNNPFGKKEYYGEFAYDGAEKAVNGEENINFELGKNYITGQVPKELQEQANKLYEAVTFLRERLKYEVDVEWLIDDCGLVILQVRPVTGIERQKKVTSFTIVDAEDINTLNQIDMSDFFGRYMKWYDKRMRLRTICKASSVKLPIVKYIFYNYKDLDVESIFLYFPKVKIFKIESELGIRTMRKEAVKDFLIDLFFRLRRKYVIVRIQQITETDFCGNSCIMSDGRIYIECMAGGFGGFLTGELDFSRYIFDSKSKIWQKDILEYDNIWIFSDETNCFERTKLQIPVKGELNDKQLKEIVYMTMVINKEIPNAKVEFEISGDHVFFNDATLEKEEFETLNVFKRIISPGDFKGKLVIMTTDELADMEKQLGTRSVLPESEFLIKQKKYIEESGVSSDSNKKILVAPYPAPCLSVLIPYYKGFIFQRGGALSHLAIILREQKKPAIIDKEIYNRDSNLEVVVKGGIVY